MKSPVELLTSHDDISWGRDLRTRRDVDVLECHPLLTSESWRTRHSRRHQAERLVNKRVEMGQTGKLCKISFIDVSSLVPNFVGVLWILCQEPESRDQSHPGRITADMAGYYKSRMRWASRRKFTNLPAITEVTIVPARYKSRSFKLMELLSF